MPKGIRTVVNELDVSRDSLVCITLCRPQLGQVRCYLSDSASTVTRYNQSQLARELPHTVSHDSTFEI